MQPHSFGLGELPGTDLAQAADIIISETSLPHIPQLPDRGIGSDLVGRTAALLDIPIDRGPRGWRVATQHRHAKDQMARDLDVLEALWHGKVDAVKVQLVGPWTLAAEIEMPNGHRMITDAGALRDLTEALEEAAVVHRADVEKRLGPTVLQLDEPALHDVMKGTVRGVTDYERIPAFPEPLERLERFGTYLLNSPVLLEADWLCVDLENITTTAQKDALAQLIDRGTRIAVAPCAPQYLWRLFDQLQIDPAEAKVDVWARPARNRAQAADNYLKAHQMLEGLA